MPFPYIYTFYSFKGGVGRSLAVLNIAYLLAGRGRHVLIVDMDLEAPGVSDFLRRHEEIESHPPGERPRDVLSLVEAALEYLPDSDDGLEEAARQLPPLPYLLWPVRAERLAPLQPKLGTLGRLDVLGSEFSPEYLQRLAGLRLKGLGGEQTTRLSNLLRIYFKNHRFAHRPLGVESFEEPLQTPYDYILIDSRTGVTEIGGLCVGPLSDRLVVLTGLNDQNVEGTATLLEEIGVELRVRRADDSKWDDADPVCGDGEESETLGPKPTILVATPVPSGETELKRKRLDYLKERLGIRPASLSYFPRLALMEALIVRDFVEEPLSREYEGLTRRVMEQIGDDAQSLWRRFNREMKAAVNSEAAVSTALRLASVEPQLGEFLLTQIHNLAIAFGEFLQTRRVSVYLASLPTRHEIALGTWGNALAQQAKQKQDEEADCLFALAYQKYQEALRIKPDQHDVHDSWGAALFDQAKQKQGEEADRLFESAYQKYQEALRVKPDTYTALSNWGATLVSQSSRVSDPERAASLRRDARTRLMEAHEIEPGSSAYNLACLSALESKAPEAIQWLEVARSDESKRVLVTQDKLADDPAFEPIRQDPEFLRYLQTLPPA